MGKESKTPKENEAAGNDERLRVPQGLNSNFNVKRCETAVMKANGEM